MGNKALHLHAVAALCVAAACATVAAAAELSPPARNVTGKGDGRSSYRHVWPVMMHTTSASAVTYYNFSETCC
jgi:hypothetical protein